MLPLKDNSLKLRDDLVSAQEKAWRRIGRAGTWFDGNMRVAIAAETRHASECALCKRRKESISPFSVIGRHDSLGVLPEHVVEPIHRIVTDPGRLTHKWFESVIASGLRDTDYVEIVGVAVTVVSIDTFCRAVGMPRYELPEPVAGVPTRHRPATAHQRGEAWVPMIHPRDLAGNLRTEEERVLARYWNGAQVKPPRALSLVPDEAFAWFQLIEAQYLPLAAIRLRRDDFRKYRAITHAQIELLATHVSRVNECAFCAPIHARFLRKIGGAGVTANQLNSPSGVEPDGNIPHGALLVAFAEAIMDDNEQQLGAIRSRLRSNMSDAALVDSAGVVAAFNGINRVASSVGLRRGRQMGMAGRF